MFVEVMCLIITILIFSLVFASVCLPVLIVSKDTFMGIFRSGSEIAMSFFTTRAKRFLILSGMLVSLLFVCLGGVLIGKSVSAMKEINSERPHVDEIYGQKIKNFKERLFPTVTDLPGNLSNKLFVNLEDAQDFQYHIMLIISEFTHSVWNPLYQDSESFVKHLETVFDYSSDIMDRNGNIRTLCRNMSGVLTSFSRSLTEIVNSYRSLSVKQSRRINQALQFIKHTKDNLDAYPVFIQDELHVMNANSTVASNYLNHVIPPHILMRSSGIEPMSLGIAKAVQNETLIAYNKVKSRMKQFVENFDKYVIPTGEHYPKNENAEWSEKFYFSDVIPAMLLCTLIVYPVVVTLLICIAIISCLVARNMWWRDGLLRSIFYVISVTFRISSIMVSVFLALAIAVAIISLVEIKSCSSNHDMIFRLTMVKNYNDNDYDYEDYDNDYGDDDDTDEDEDSEDDTVLTVDCEKLIKYIGNLSSTHRDIYLKLQDRNMTPYTASRVLIGPLPHLGFDITWKSLTTLNSIIISNTRVGNAVGHFLNMVDGTDFEILYNAVKYLADSNMPVTVKLRLEKLLEIPMKDLQNDRNKMLVSLEVMNSRIFSIYHEVNESRMALSKLLKDTSRWNEMQRFGDNFVNMFPRLTREFKKLIDKYTNIINYRPDIFTNGHIAMCEEYNKAITVNIMVLCRKYLSASSTGLLGQWLIAIFLAFLIIFTMLFKNAYTRSDESIKSFMWF